MTDDHPTVFVRPKADPHTLVVLHCPWCQKRHSHGTGGLPGPDYGSVVAPCAQADLPSSLRGRTLGYKLRALWG